MNGIRFGNTVKTGGDSFKFFKTFDIAFHQFFSCSRTGGGQGVCCLHKNSKGGFRMLVFMVGRDGVDDFFAFTVFFGDISPDQRVGPFDFMVDRFAYVMEQTCAFRFFHVHAEFRRHHAAKRGNFQRVLQNVLGEACSVFQLSEQADDFRMNTVHAGVKGRLLADFANLDIKFFFTF